MLLRLYAMIVIICMLLLGWGGMSAAQQRGLAPALLDKARTDGTVRVLVHLNMATQPEGSIQTATAVLNQRKEIEAAQTETVAALAGKHHRITQQFRTIPFVAMEVAEDTLPVLARSRRVLQVVEDHLSKPLLAQSVPLVEANQAWAAGFDGSGWVVAVLDTGVDQTHPMLAGKVVSEACYSANGNCPNGLTSQVSAGAAIPCTYDSGCAHGTHVAGIAAGRSSTLSGVARGARVIAIQVFSRFTGSACLGASTCALSYTSDQLAALERIYTLRGTYQIAAVNMSLGGGAYTSQASCDAANAATKAAIDNLRSVGIATVIASGNDGYGNALSAPGCISSAVSVGSTTESDEVSWFSNSASFLSLLAPGESITSAVPGGGFATWSGTSMATPHVAGAWAILKQKTPTSSVSTVLSALQTTGRPITDPGNGITKSRIQIAHALALSAPQLTVVKAGTGSGTVTSTPAGLTCGATCSATFAQGQSVTLRATAASGSTFTGWSGAGCSGTGQCTVSMTQARSVTATFTRLTTVAR